jgi:RNA polymerase sigma-70 factor (ECF subfamily)
MPAAGTERVTTKPAAGKIDDAALVRAAQGGDQGAFEELVRLYDRPVLRLALNLTRSEEDARDAYQEAFLKVYRSLGNFRFECSFYTWIYRIVNNVCLDQLRKKAVRKEEKPVLQSNEGESEPTDFFAQVPDDRPAGDPERDMIRRELGHKISVALKRLTPRERMVFELKHYQGLKLRTIGEMLETSEQTAKNCLFRATQKLRESLGEA